MKRLLQSQLWRRGTLLMSAFLLTGCGEYVEEEIELGFQGLAKFDHFLGAARLLTELGMEAESHARIPEFPPPPNTMLFLPVTSIEGEGMLSILDDWIYNEGGTLVAYLKRGGKRDFDLLSYDDQAGEEFFEYLEVEYEEVEGVFSEDYYKDYENSPDDSGEEENTEDDDTQISSMSFNNDSMMRENYETDFHSPYTIHFTGDEEEEKGNISLDYEYGEGRVIIWSTAEPFTNDGLQKKEHATMLWDMIQYAEAEKVWFVHSSKLSFWKLLWEYGAYAIITLALLLFLWLWASTRRLGPLFKTVDNIGNTLSEHLHVSGSFFTKHRADALIIEEVKKKLFLKLARKTNLPINSDPEAILQACEKHSLLPTEQLTLLRSPLPKNKKEHLLYLSTIQQLYKSL